MVLCFLKNSSLLSEQTNTSKTLLSVFSARINCGKLMPCKYLTPFFSVFIFKTATTKNTTFTNVALKAAR
jgi:hypothetical protein